MRPRRIVVLYADALTIPLLRLPLECAHYRVIAEDTPAGALAAAKHDAPDVILCDVSGGRLLVADMMHTVAPAVPLILMGTEAQMYTLHPGTRFLVDPSMAELRECIKLLCVRRSGPKLGSHRAVRVAA